MADTIPASLVNIEDVDNSNTITNPELVFGLIGPIGVNLDQVVQYLSEALSDVGYKSIRVHLTDHMITEKLPLTIDTSSYFSKYESLIAYANAFRKLAERNDAMAGLAISRIRFERDKLTSANGNPALGTAYIIRQFKRNEEVDLMRKTYGRKFILISVFGSELLRQNALVSKIRGFNNAPRSDDECTIQAIQLIKKDYEEKDDKNGQRLSDTFHLGDVFVDGLDQTRCRATIERFIRAFFGLNAASPNRDEYGLYTAAAASLRSVDLSRQIGAAIFSKSGEVITLGCNEVPKAKGRTYWIDEHPGISRDIENGNDPNQERRNVILYDFIERMGEVGLLSDELKNVASIQARVDKVLSIETIKDAQVMDIIEFGRIIHAEMGAITDAARLGKPITGATLFCTTFPCHLCAKHIVAAGIDRVVFLEPYPKSYAKQLHADSITFDKDVNNKVLFEPFIGISPRRYRDIFEKKRRKDKNGKANTWYENDPAPMIEDRGSSYMRYEEGHLFKALKAILQTTS